MMFFNNKIGIHIYDGIITLCDSHHRIVSGPFCKIIQDKGQNSDNVCTYSLFYPFRGSVVGDFQMCETIFRQYIKMLLPKIHLRTTAYFSVSPVSGVTELMAIRDLFKFHQSYLSFEPIAFLHGIHKEDGVVISINRTMLEVSLIENLKIKKYKWQYLYESYYQSKYSVIKQSIKDLLKSIDNNVYGIKNKIKCYIIGEKDIIHNLIRFYTDDEFECELYPNPGEIIAENIFDAPREEF